MKPRLQTAVIDIRTGAYTRFDFGVSTHVESKAASALVPGTTYGQGETEQAARSKAEESRQRFLATGY